MTGDDVMSTTAVGRLGSRRNPRGLTHGCKEQLLRNIDEWLTKAVQDGSVVSFGRRLGVNRWWREEDRDHPYNGTATITIDINGGARDG